MEIKSPDIVLRIIEKAKTVSEKDVQKLSKEEQKQFAKIVNEKKKVEYIMVRLLLRDIVGENYSEIQYEHSGKPRMQNIPISISHCKTHIAVIVGNQCNVAVDIENYREQIFRVKEKFVNVAEKLAFTTKEDLILLWCAKETLFKLTNATFNLNNYIVSKTKEFELEGKIVINKHVKKIIKLLYFRNQQFCVVWAIEKI